MKEDLDSIPELLAGANSEESLDKIEETLAIGDHREAFPARTAAALTMLSARRWTIRVNEARQRVEAGDFAEVQVLIGAIPSDHPSAPQAAELAKAASGLAANSIYLARRQDIDDRHQALVKTSKKECQLAESSSLAESMGLLAPAAKAAGVVLASDVAAQLLSFGGLAGRLRGHPYREVTIPNLLDKPTLWEPEYSGAFYLSGTLREQYSDGLLVQKGSTYYCVYNAVAVGGYSRYIEGYVEPTGRTQNIDIGRHGRDCQIVNYSNRETYQDDQAAHRERVKAAKADYRAERARYNESKSARRAATRKKAKLEREYEALCRTTRAEMEDFYEGVLKEALVEPPMVPVPHGQ